MSEGGSGFDSAEPFGREPFGCEPFGRELRVERLKAERFRAERLVAGQPRNRLFNYLNLMMHTLF